MNWRLLHSAGIPVIGRWRQFPDPKLSHRYAECDLAMKAKALSECSNPDELHRHWRKEPGFMVFLRSQ